jgi:DNA-binding NarL/FixJ family response regulator
MFNENKSRKENITIVIADDHEIIRDSLKRMLDVVDGIDVVGICKNGLEAYKKTKTSNPHIVLLDAIMPECDGIEATRLIKKYNENIKVLMLTTFSDDALIFNSFHAGVDGYILKDITADHLIRNIYDCVEGSLIIPSNIAQKLVKKITSIQMDKAFFTETEKEIIPLMIDGMTNKEISDKLHISYGTVRNYISDIYRKIGTTQRQDAVEKLQNFEL